MKTQNHKPNDVYRCFSKPLKDKLIKLGFKYLPEGKKYHSVTGNPFWKFPWTPDLQVVLDDWTAQRIARKEYQNK